MYGRFKSKRRTNLAILSQTLKDVANEENLQKEPPKVQQVIIEQKQSKPKPSKREVGIEGNGIIEKQMQKKGPEFINFKSLLTS
jgi:hypothetical protein